MKQINSKTAFLINGAKHKIGTRILIIEVSGIDFTLLQRSLLVFFLKQSKPSNFGCMRTGARSHFSSHQVIVLQRWTILDGRNVFRRFLAPDQLA